MALASYTRTDVRFAQCLALFPSIWNNKSMLYRNKQKRKNDFESLAMMCELSVRETERKYSNVRTYYKKQLDRINLSKNMGCEGEDVFVSKWPLFDHLAFLNPVLDGLNDVDYPQTCLEESSENLDVTMSTSQNLETSMSSQCLEPSQNLEVIVAVSPDPKEISTSSQCLEEPSQNIAVTIPITENSKGISLLPQVEDKNLFDMMALDKQMKEQKKKYDALIMFLSEKRFAPGLSLNQKRAIRARANCYYLCLAGNVLYYVGRNLNMRRQVVMSAAEVLEILKDCHVNECGSHNGLNSTITKISSSYYWKCICDNVREYVEACEHCRHDNRVNKASQMVTVEVEEMLELDSMDFIDTEAEDSMVDEPRIMPTTVKGCEERFSDFKEKCRKIVNFLKNGKVVELLNKNGARFIRNNGMTHVLDSATGELYYTGCEEGRRKKCVTEVSVMKEILKQYHSNPMGGHSGINSTLAKISTFYVWNGMREDVTDYVLKCEKCNEYKQLKTKLDDGRRCTKVTQVLQLVTMDIMGPLPTTNRGYNHVLTFTDYFSKFVDFIALKSKQSEDIAKGIKTFICRWGAPQKLLSDQDQEIINVINGAVCKVFDIKRAVVSSFNSCEYEFDENTNNTLTIRLSKLTNEHQNNWDEFLEDVAFSIRTQIHPSTNYSPFYVMFGRHPRTPMEMDRSQHSLNSSSLPEPTPEDKLDGSVESRLKINEDIIQQVAKKVNYSRKSSKKIGELKNVQI